MGIDAVQAQPSPPATFAGTVKANGQAVPDGTSVLALVNGRQCGESSREPGQTGTWTLDKDVADLGMRAGDSIYIIDVASDSQTPGCGTEEATVAFQVAGQPSHETGVWKAGFNSLNLTVAQALTPASTPTPTDMGEDSDSTVRWWIPAAGGGGALIAAGLLATIWRRRTATGRQR